MQRLIILRGTPASGKSSIAKNYRNFEEKVVWLKVDNFKDFFTEDATIALEFVNGSAIATLGYLLSQGFSVVVDGVFQNTTAVDNALQFAKEKNIPARVFELTASLEMLLKRDNQRKGVLEGLRKPLGREAITKIFNILAENLYPNAIKLNTEENSIERCKGIIDSYFK